MSTSLENSLEQFAIDKVTAAARRKPFDISSLNLAHYDAGPTATDNRIVFRGKQGSTQSEGARCTEIELSIELRMTRRDVAFIDSVMAIIDEAMVATDAPASVLKFSVLTLKGFDNASEREAKKDTRSHERIFNFLAKLA